METLGVEVRRDGQWVPATGVSIDPPYPLSAAAGAYASYTLRFEAVAADGVRIVGKSGGAAAFTTISELTAGYDG